MNFFGKSKKKGTSKPSSMFNFGHKAKFSGSGAALGGTRPGTLTPVIFSNPGPLGMSIERTETGSAVISRVDPGGLAEESGVKRGDVICWSGGDGEEAGFDEFMAVVKEGERPLEVLVKRLSVSISTPSVSAASDARRAAVIAAAEKRNDKSKKMQRPLPKRPIDLKNNTKLYDHSDVGGAKTEEAKRAVEAARAGEVETANRLGYNPYETVKMSSGKARQAQDRAANGDVGKGGGGSGGGVMEGPGRVSRPIEPNGYDEVISGNGSSNSSSTATSSNANVTSIPGTDDNVGVTTEFEDALSLLSSQSENIGTLKVICKLLVNASTKGQQPDGGKYLLVKCSNKTIQSKICNVEGGMEMMLSLGFVLEEKDGETVLKYGGTKKWIGNALRIMEGIAG